MKLLTHKIFELWLLEDTIAQGTVCSVLLLFMLLPIAFTTGQAAALAKLTLKLELGYSCEMAIRSFQE